MVLFSFHNVFFSIVVGNSCSDITDIVVLPQDIRLSLDFVEIRCTHNGNLAFNSFSTPSGLTITVTILGKYLIDSFSYYTSLFILNLELADIGQYQCKFHNERTGAECIGQVELELNIQFCTPNSITYHKYIGESVVLECCVEQYNSQFWRREGSTEAINVNASLNIEFEGTGLKLNYISLEDEGKYYCVAENTDGETESIQCSLKVYGTL